MTAPEIRLRQLIFGHLSSQIVASAVRLGIVDALAGGPRSGRELAQLTGAPPDVLLRFLRACAALGLLERRADDVFALTPLGEWLRSGRRSLRDLAVAMAAPGHWRSIERLLETVRTGRPAPPSVLGTDLWEYYRHNPEEGAAFAAAMSNVSEVVAEEVVDHLDVSAYRRIVDVGGSQGVVLARLLEANPSAEGVLFDLPEVLDGARATIEARGLADRVELRSGDFFEEVPAGGDLYVLKHILHDWDDEHAANILRSCHRASRPGSTIVLVERLLGPESSPVDYVADLLMLVMFGGKERSQPEFEELLAAGGYRLERVVPLSLFALLEARRA
ncbi:MAG TPA: methyltransferase [Acidimicrobiales bacterium]|nr:methyltransferase [Acidimicrobiales bacterium]